jgi:hypothetical protein
MKAKFLGRQTVRKMTAHTAIIGEVNARPHIFLIGVKYYGYPEPVDSGHGVAFVPRSLLALYAPARFGQIYLPFLPTMPWHNGTIWKGGGKWRTTRGALAEHVWRLYDVVNLDVDFYLIEQGIVKRSQGNSC